MAKVLPTLESTLGLLERDVGSVSEGVEDDPVAVAKKVAPYKNAHPSVARGWPAEDDKDDSAFKSYEVQRMRQEIEELKNKNFLRKVFAVAIGGYTLISTAIILYIVFDTSYTHSQAYQEGAVAVKVAKERLTDVALSVLCGAFFAHIVALLAIVARYLFSPDTSQYSSVPLTPINPPIIPNHNLLRGEDQEP